MKIKEVEELVGITKKNIRYYEDEGLITPNRNADNGYREYTEENIETLKKIKLLRKLSVPIEEIRRLETGVLTLSDSMERHMIALKRQEENIINMQEMCRRISTDAIQMTDSFADTYLEEMNGMEKEGMQFMNIKTKDQKKKLYGPIIASAVAIAFLVLLIGIFIWACSIDTPPLLLIIFLIIFPVAGIIGIILALRERMKEIKGGEEDEASKY